ncbi:MAG: TIGR00730 family Rossman fold protein [Prevotella sp.]|nr:TIGR00730 family Rossman fold protein [Prevotella sp.]
MKVAVYCSANGGIDPDFFAMTEELGAWLAENGHTLVFGGCNLGLMECVARAVKTHGGRTIGVVPTIVERGGRMSEHVDVHIPCDSLDDRKALMVAQSDINVALPGGIGTLDEIFTVLAAASIGFHQKKVVLYNMKGFWDSLLSMLADLEQRGVIREGFRRQLLVAGSLEELAALLK